MSSTRHCKKQALSRQADWVKSKAMKLSEKLEGIWRVPPLTRLRIILALAVAVAADGLQLLLGPLGWTFADEVIDVVAMAATIWILGFHVLLLPTFVIELVPVADMLPTWTGCVAAVIALRKRGQKSSPPRPPEKPIIDI